MCPTVLRVLSREVEGPDLIAGLTLHCLEQRSMEKHPSVYILASQSRVLYIGVTSSLTWRMWKHKTGVFEGFSKKYHVDRLVYFERFASMKEAISREKQLKGWRRSKKVWLIERENPNWSDLAEGWFDDPFWCMPAEREVGVYGYLQ